MYLFYSKRIKCIKRKFFLFVTYKIELFCWCKIPITHLRTMLPPENAIYLLLKCVRAPDRSVQSWSGKWLTALGQKVLFPGLQLTVLGNSHGTRQHRQRETALLKGKVPKWLSDIAHFYCHLLAYLWSPTISSQGADLDWLVENGVHYLLSHEREISVVTCKLVIGLQMKRWRG